MKAEGIIQKIIRKWVEWEGLDKNVDLLDVEQDLIEEIKKITAGIPNPAYSMMDYKQGLLEAMLGTESETKE